MQPSFSTGKFPKEKNRLALKQSTEQISVKFTIVLSVKASFPGLACSTSVPADVVWWCILPKPDQQGLK